MLASLGCITQRGGPWRAAKPEAAPATEEKLPSVVLLGEATASGSTAATVAKGLSSALAGDRTAVVLWLGESNAARKRERCASLAEASQRKGVADLVAVLDEHRAAGGSVFGVRGEAATLCASRTPATESSPISIPAAQYVVTLANDGTATVTLRCNEDGCERTPTDRPGAVELVVVDIAPWIATRRAASEDSTLLALEHLLDALESDSPDAGAPARVLVSHYPVEAAGYQGLGGGDPDSTIHNWPPRLGDAILRGAFVGALGGHDRSTYATGDLTSALKRADRRWAEQPMFQVVSAAASAPDGLPRNAYRRMRYFNASTYVPTASTPRAGFAMVQFGEQRTTATLYGHRGWRWQRTRVELTLTPAPASTLTRSPSMAPCLRCPAKPYNEWP